MPDDLPILTAVRALRERLADLPGLSDSQVGRVRSELKELVVDAARALAMEGALGSTLMRNARHAKSQPRTALYVVLSRPWIGEVGPDELDAFATEGEAVCYLLAESEVKAEHAAVVAARALDLRLAEGRVVWAIALATWLRAARIPDDPKVYVAREPSRRLPTLDELIAMRS